MTFTTPHHLSPSFTDPSFDEAVEHVLSFLDEDVEAVELARNIHSLRKSIASLPITCKAWCLIDAEAMLAADLDDKVSVIVRGQPDLERDHLPSLDAIINRLREPYQPRRLHPMALHVERARRAQKLDAAA